MSTILRLGRADHGRPMTLEEFLAGDYEEGNRYELIGGRLYVTPAETFPEAAVHDWLSFQLKLYARGNPQLLKYVATISRVFIPDRPDLTAPEPDVAAYREFPTELPLRDIRWEDLSPFLVAEVLSADDPNKDLVRNRELYFLVPSIKGYWVFDAREDADHPGLRVHIRHGKRWRTRDVEPRSTYTTRLLPGFTLTLDVRA
jgi:Uma2 family endonuclease